MRGQHHGAAEQQSTRGLGNRHGLKSTGKGRNRSRPRRHKLTKCRWLTDIHRVWGRQAIVLCRAEGIGCDCGIIFNAPENLSTRSMTEYYGARYVQRNPRESLTLQQYWVQKGSCADAGD